MMFDPEAAKNAKAIKAAKKKVTEGLKDLALSIIPPDLQEGLLLNVKEIICGDPECMCVYIHVCTYIYIHYVYIHIYIYYLFSYFLFLYMSTFKVFLKRWG